MELARECPQAKAPSIVRIAANAFLPDVGQTLDAVRQCIVDLLEISGKVDLAVADLLNHSSRLLNDQTGDDERRDDDGDGYDQHRDRRRDVAPARPA